MSSLRKGAPPPRMKKKSPDTVISNGNGSTSLYYPNDPPDDENMNEIADENIELTVLLPEGKVKETSVNSNIPMMDLLVNLAARNKLSPAGYTIVVLNENTKKPTEYKPNQTVGSLCPKSEDRTPRHMTVQLAPKKGDADKQRNVKNAQPFEMTYRFTVNLAQNQKKVLRISPATLLEDVHKQICSEKNLDPFRYTFHLPSDPYTKVNMQLTVGELKSNEINLTASGPVNSAMSMPNLAVDRGQSPRSEQNVSFMPSAGETKKKKGFFSFLKKDNSKKFSVQNVQRDTFVEQPVPARDRAPARQISDGGPPARPQYEGNPGARPKTMYAVSTPHLDKISDAKVPPLDLSGLDNSQSSTSKSKSLSALKTTNDSEKIALAPPRKKRRAPAPPQAQSVQNTVKVEISVEKTNLEKQVTKSKVENNEVRQRTEHISKFHSRNSSDSSGYHELTLSGAESPDGQRIIEQYEPNVHIETVSLDSGGHLNGDSGIRDMSPSSSRKQDIEIGSSQTLPLERTKKKGVTSSTPRSSSLDRTGKKKKAAPPPPGSPPKPPVTTSSLPSSAPVSQTKKKDEDDVAINAVLDSLNQNLDDQNVSGTDMMMVENTSVHSEDIDIDLNQQTPSHPPRPCAFVAPPPPLEPPPDDTEPVDYNMIINGRVDTVDVGVETSDDSTSYGPVSTRSSTESPVSKNPTYQTEMAQFVEKMKEMTVDGESYQTSRKGFNTNSEDEKVDEAVYVFSNDGEDSVEMENVPETYNEPEEETSDDVNRRHSNRDVSEITYDFRLSEVPAEFQSEMEAPDEVDFPKEENEPQQEEEEVVVTETVEIFYPFSPPFVEPKTVEEDVKEVEHIPQIKPVDQMEDTRAEIKPVDEIEEAHAEMKKNSELKSEENVPSQKQEKIENKVKRKEEEKIKEPEKPKEKEKIVLTFDDIYNVDFSMMRKKKKVDPKPKPANQSTPEKMIKVSAVEETKSSIAINNDNVFITPCKEHNVEMDDGSILTEGGSVRGHKGEVKTKCSELSFSPNSEGEMENVLEEKSISMINLPAVRKNLENSIEDQTEVVNDDIKVSRTEIVFSMNSGSSKPQSVSSERKLSTNSNLEQSVNDSGVEAEDLNIADHQEVLSAQYKQLQQQFVVWQAQLEENKKLLQSSQAIPADNTSRQFQQQLESQIQLQQQMIQQMQQSMEALSTQQQQQKNEMEDKSKQKQLTQSVVEQLSQTVVTPNQTSQSENSIHTEKQKEVKVENGIPPAPEAPPLPNGKLVSDNKGQKDQNKQKSKSKSKKHIEPKLDPREELMIAIRNFGGRSAMKKVPVNQTHWHSGVP